MAGASGFLKKFMPSLLKGDTGNSSDNKVRQKSNADWANTELGQLVVQIDDEMNEAETGYYYDLKISNSETYQKIKANQKTKTQLARFMYENRQAIFTPYTNHDRDWNFSTWRGVLIFHTLMRSTLDIEPDELLDWLLIFEAKSGIRKSKGHNVDITDWPVGHMIQMIERKAKKIPLTKTALDKLEAILKWDRMGSKAYYFGPDFEKIQKRVEKLLGDARGTDLAAISYKKLSGDSFGDALEAELNALGPEEAEKWNRTLNLADSANGGKPTKKFLKESKELKETIGKEWVRKHIQDWLARANTTKVVTKEHRHTYIDRQKEQVEYFVTAQYLFTPSNGALLKGLVWVCDGFQDAKTINLIADLCEKSMKKLAGVGPAAQSTANACMWYLEVTPGTDATARLARLGTAIKQKGMQKKVAKIVAQKAEAAGITTIQLEERVVPDYGLQAGEKSVDFDDYQLNIKVEGPGKVIQTWIKPDGSPQKTKPKFVAEKAALKTKFDKIKGEVVALKKVLTAQRDRIDRLFAEDLEWPLEEINTYYVGHGLVGVLAQKLIWSLTTGKKTTPVIWQNGEWQDIKGKPVKTDETTTARLWHPIDWTTDEVIAWRERLIELEIVQPTKQAWREVYILTDAERNTDVYSNRMASHMLKQHQMATLMAARGWRYQLMGAYDDGLDDQWAYKSFVTSDLNAEYLLHSNYAEDNFNDAGIYLYVGTDQLRFVRGGTPVPLDTVPARLLSETMREADLFVGVASVGNDPAWFDQGPTPELRNYWQSYSFGVLDNFAETRKAMLEAIIPRLKIRDVAHIDGKFLIVDGKLNTYKIHLGSSNILMAPGDRYLCIVPGDVSKAGQVALPFEGDNRLSVILSKAMMLADDDKIKAADIVSQLKR